MPLRHIINKIVLLTLMKVSLRVPLLPILLYTSGFFGAGSRFIACRALATSPGKGPARKTSTMRSDKTETIHAKMMYVDPSTNIAHVGRSTTGDDESEIQVTWKPQHVPMYDARKAESSPSLLVSGAELISNVPPETSPSDSPIDFLDSHDVMDRYYPYCESLVKECLQKENHGEQGPSLVVAFDHNVRIAQPSNQDVLKNAGESKLQQPIHTVHGDYTSISAPKRLQLLSEAPKANDVWKDRLGDTPLVDSTLVQEALQGKRRFAFINLWRSIDRENPIQAFPLAFVDATTVHKDELKTLQFHYTDRVGENYLAVHNPRHRWLYFKEMVYSEALLIKQWDSVGGLACGCESDVENGISTFSIHSAFDLRPPPSSDSVAAPSRKSIEVRCVIIF